MIKKYRQLEKGEFIVAGYDLAAGAGDYCAVQFISQNRVDVPLVYHSPLTASRVTPEIATILNEIHDQTGIIPIIAPETNNGGVYECDRLVTLNHAGKYRVYKQKIIGKGESEETEKLGFSTTTANRSAILRELKDAVDSHTITIYDKQTISEFYSFINKQTATGWKPQAELHAHDDLVMAMAIAWQLFQTEKKEVRGGSYHVPSKNIMQSMSRHRYL